MPMTVPERVSLCRQIEKIDKNKAYAKVIGLSNVSKFRGKETGKRKIENRCHSVPGMAFSC